MAGEPFHKLPDFGVYAVGLKGSVYLASLIELGARPALVSSYRQADDKSAGFDVIAELCRSHDIVVHETRRPAHDAGLPLFLIGWQYLLPTLSPNIVVMHDSLLPQYRGYAPTVTALLKGEPLIGVSAFRPVASVDGGPIVGQRSMPVTYPIRIEEALRRQARLMAQLTLDILPRFESAIANATVQDESNATFSIWRDQQDYRIDWNDSAVTIRRMIDAVSFPYAGAIMKYEDRLLVVDQASEVADVNFAFRHPGKFLRLDNNRPVVICGHGLLRLDRVLAEDGSEFRFEKLRVRLT